MASERSFQSEVESSEKSLKTFGEQLSYETSYVQKVQENLNGLQQQYDSIQTSITGQGVYQQGQNVDQLNEKLSQINAQQSDMSNDMINHNQKKTDLETSFQFSKASYEKKVSDFNNFRASNQRKFSSLESHEQKIVSKIRLFNSKIRRYKSIISSTIHELKSLNEKLSRVISKRLFQQKIVKKTRKNCINLNKKTIMIRYRIVFYEKKNSK